MIIYDFALFCYFLFLLPKFLFERFFFGKYKRSLKERLGLNLPEVEKRGNTIWIHAVSVGETKAVSALAKALHERDKRTTIIISNITETGHEEAKRSIPFADCFLFLPFDFSFIMKRLMKKYSPTLVILSEGDIWYNFLRFAKQNGAKIAIVSAKLSERSCFFYAHFFKRVFAFFDLICAQDKTYEVRFKKVGVPSEKIVVTGNLKYDRELSDTKLEVQTQRDFKIGDQDLFITIASTHAPEEKMLLEALNSLFAKHPNLKLFLAPRHPERFRMVENLLKEKKLPYVTYTKRSSSTGQERVLLIDTMGVLDFCYKHSFLTIMGGSFTPKVGGHNLLEPLFWGNPVIFGEYTSAQKNLETLVLNWGVGFRVEYNQIEQIIDNFLQNNSVKNEVKEKIEKLINSLKGGVERTLRYVQTLNV